MEYSYDIHRQKQKIKELNTKATNVDNEINIYKEMQEWVNMSVYDLFQQYKEQYKKELKTAPKQLQDKLIEQISKTELFDITNVRLTEQDHISCVRSIEHPYLYKLGEAVYDLPFDYMYVKGGSVVGNNYGVYTMRLVEETPDVIVFQILIKCSKCALNVHYQMNTKRKMFILTHIAIEDVLDKGIDVTFESFTLPPEVQELYTQTEPLIISMITNLFIVLNKLNKHVSLVDISTKPEYYTFKDKTRKTVKVESRPIYYILDKQTYERKKYDIKPITKLEYSHAFRVRGHWRKIQDGNIGKDRSGVYRIQNYTWVIDHIRGEGELVKRLRIVK